MSLVLSAIPGDAIYPPRPATTQHLRFPDNVQTPGQHIYNLWSCNPIVSDVHRPHYGVSQNSIQRLFVDYKLIAWVYSNSNVRGAAIYGLAERGVPKPLVSRLKPGILIEFATRSTRTRKWAPPSSNPAHAYSLCACLYTRRHASTQWSSRREVYCVYNIF